MMIKIGKAIVRSLDRITDAILYLILFLALALWAYSLWESQQVYQTAASANYTAFRPAEDSELSFDELRAVNPEVIAWLTVNGTPIDYPGNTGSEQRKIYQHRCHGELYLVRGNFPGLQEQSFV